MGTTGRQPAAGDRPPWLREMVLMADPRAGELARAAQGSVPGDAPTPSVLLGLHCTHCGHAVAVLIDAGHSLEEAAIAVATAGHCLHAPPSEGAEPA